MEHFEIAPTISLNIEAFRSKEISSDFATRMNNLFATTSERCELFGCRPSFSEVVKQFRLYTLMASQRTGNFKLSTLRKLCRILLNTHQKAQEAGIWLNVCDAFPIGIDPPDWIDDDWETVKKLAAYLKENSPATIKNNAAGLMREMIVEQIKLGNFGTESEIAIQILGYPNVGGVSDSRRPPQRRWEKIDEQVLNKLISQIPEAKRGIQNRISVNDLNHPDMTRILATATWLTGMRCIEVFSCRLMRPQPNINLQNILDNPLYAYRKGLLELWPQGLKCDGQKNNSRSNCSYPILIVKTAKSDLASPNIDNRERALILNGISPAHLEKLRIAATLRDLKLSPSEIKTAHNACKYHLLKASKRAFPQRADTISLHTMRHAFADNAKHALDAASAAALTGHTAPKTIRGYGKRFPSKSGCLGLRWLPQPDQAQAKLIQSVWEMNKQKRVSIYQKIQSNPHWNKTKSVSPMNPCDDFEPGF